LPPQTDALRQLLSIISVEQDIDETLSRQDDEGDLEASDDSDADDSDANHSDADDQSATVDDAAGERLNEQTIDCSMLRNVLDEAVVKYSQEILGLDSRKQRLTSMQPFFKLLSYSHTSPFTMFLTNSLFSL
jgi:hypothetical protein